MVELKNVFKTYQMGKVQVKALQDVSLAISAGEFVAIMGPSGSGKSTLMHILGLLDRPDSGSYNLGKRKINELADEELAAVRNRLVGFVFQQFHLLPRMTALENAELPLVYAGKQQQKHKAQEKIKEVGLSDRARHRPSELSGGQQQRVAIARALVNEPLILMADEPTGNLDSKSQEEIMAVLTELNRKGKTVIMVTHEKEVAAHAQRIIHMRDGRIISDERAGPAAKSDSENQADKIIDVVLSKRERLERKAKFADYLRQALSALGGHKMRSFLSILGILIGVAAVIAMLAIGQGAKDAIEKQLASLGSNLLVVRAGAHRPGGVAVAAGTVTRFTFLDVAAVQRLTDYVSRVSPQVSGRVQMVYGNKNWNTGVDGVGVDYAAMRAAQPAVGRFFSEEEVQARERVVVLGPTVVKELFGKEDPIGETIKINLVNFKVIGVLPSKGANHFHDQDDTAVMPVTTAMYRVLGKEYIDTIFVEIKTPQLLDPAQEALAELIKKTHHLKKDQEESFQIRNMAEFKETMEATTQTMSLLLGAIAGISLLVGGIGIMNIMLVSVTERTREIGLRKAVGANDRDIMSQFLIEAVLMTLIGGIAGIILGAAASRLISLIAGWTVTVSLFSVVLATSFSLVIGVVFGMWPARKASRLDPIEALRYE